MIPIRTAKDMLTDMIEFQRMNGVVAQCVTNTQYLYDCYRVNGLRDIKAKAFIVVHLRGDELIYIAHLALSLYDSIIEPSHEVSQIQNKHYYATIAELVNSVKSNNIPIDREFLYKTIKHHAAMIDLANKINNGDLIVADKDHYNRQADYVESRQMSRKASSSPSEGEVVHCSYKV